VTLSELDDDGLRRVLADRGSAQAAADALGVPRTTFRRELDRRGLAPPPAPRRRSSPRLTRESLHAALAPPNNCRVKAFLDGLDAETRLVVEEGLDYPKEEFSAAALRDWLIREGFPAADVPGNDAINDHRAGRRPCRCRG
jgi:hypothetical protein